MRNVAVDPGIRDEGVEHASIFPSVYGMTRWAWVDLWRYWQAPANRKNSTALTTESL